MAPARDPKTNHRRTTCHKYYGVLGVWHLSFISKNPGWSWCFRSLEPLQAAGKWFFRQERGRPLWDLEPVATFARGDQWIQYIGDVLFWTSESMEVYSWEVIYKRVIFPLLCWLREGSAKDPTLTRSRRAKDWPRRFHRSHLGAQWLDIQVAKKRGVLSLELRKIVSI